MDLGLLEWHFRAGEGAPGEWGDVSYLKQLLGNRWAANTQEDAQELFTELYNRQL